MLLAFLTDWGAGERLMALWLLVPVAVLVQAARVYVRRRDFNDCVWLVFAGLLLLVLVSATVFDAESNRRETAQLDQALKSGLEIDEVVQLSTSTPFTVVRLDHCRVTLDVRRPSEHVWTAAIKSDAEAQVPIGPKLQTRLEAYCTAKAVAN